MTSAQPAAPPVRRPRWPRRVLIGLLVLVVLLLAVDRIGDYAAEQVGAGALQKSQNLPNEPDVDIGGFPFLTQFASGHYDDVTVTGTDVPLGRGSVSVTLDRLRVVLDDLTVTNGFHDFHAASAHATGTLGYDKLSRFFGVDITYAGKNRIRISKQFTIFGRTFKPTVTLAPQVTTAGLGFAGAQVSQGGAIADRLAQLAEQLFDTRLPLNGIPFQLRLGKDPFVDAAGLNLDLVGSDLTYRR